MQSGKSIINQKLYLLISSCLLLHQGGILFANEESEKSPALLTSSKASLGYGMPHGGTLGVEVETELRDNVCASVGFSISQGMVVGVRFYLREVHKRFRPTASYHLWLGNAPTQTANGAFFAGLEIRPKFAKRFVLTTGVGYGSIKRGQKIGVSIGLGFNINLQLITTGF